MYIPMTPQLLVATTLLLACHCAFPCEEKRSRTDIVNHTCEPVGGRIYKDGDQWLMTTADENKQNIVVNRSHAHIYTFNVSSDCEMDLLEIMLQYIGFCSASLAFGNTTGRNMPFPVSPRQGYCRTRVRIGDADLSKWRHYQQSMRNKWRVFTVTVMKTPSVSARSQCVLHPVKLRSSSGLGVYWKVSPKRPRMTTVRRTATDPVRNSSATPTTTNSEVTTISTAINGMTSSDANTEHIGPSLLTSDSHTTTGHGSGESVDPMDRNGQNNSSLLIPLIVAAVLGALIISILVTACLIRHGNILAESQIPIFQCIRKADGRGRNRAQAGQNMNADEGGEDENDTRATRPANQNAEYNAAIYSEAGPSCKQDIRPSAPQSSQSEPEAPSYDYPTVPPQVLDKHEPYATVDSAFSQAPAVELLACRRQGSTATELDVNVGVLYTCPQKSKSTDDVTLHSKHTTSTEEEIISNNDNGNTAPDIDQLYSQPRKSEEKSTSSAGDAKGYKQEMVEQGTVDADDDPDYDDVENGDENLYSTPLKKRLRRRTDDKERSNEEHDHPAPAAASDSQQHSGNVANQLNGENTGTDVPEVEVGIESCESTGNTSISTMTNSTGTSIPKPLPYGTFKARKEKAVQNENPQSDYMAPIDAIGNGSQPATHTEDVYADPANSLGPSRRVTLEAQRERAATGADNNSQVDGDVKDVARQCPVYAAVDKIGLHATTPE